MRPTFTDYATSLGLTPVDSPLIDVIDAALEYLDTYVRPFPPSGGYDDDRAERWFNWANARADRLVDEFDASQA